MFYATAVLADLTADSFAGVVLMEAVGQSGVTQLGHLGIAPFHRRQIHILRHLATVGGQQTGDCSHCNVGHPGVIFPHDVMHGSDLRGDFLTRGVPEYFPPVFTEIVCLTLTSRNVFTEQVTVVENTAQLSQHRNRPTTFRALPAGYRALLLVVATMVENYATLS